MRETIWDFAERTGTEMRAALGLAPTVPLLPHRLADRLGCLVITPGDIPDLPEWAMNQLVLAKPHVWSGIAFTVRSKRVIVLNNLHSPGRRNATLMEELAHFWLQHEPSHLTQISDGLRMRVFNDRQEAEAYAVGTAALMPKAALELCLATDASIAEFALEYGVSTDVIKYRLKVTRLWRRFLERERSRTLPLLGRDFDVHGTGRPRTRRRQPDWRTGAQRSR